MDLKTMHPIPDATLLLEGKALLGGPHAKAHSSFFFSREFHVMPLWTPNKSLRRRPFHVIFTCLVISFFFPTYLYRHITHNFINFKLLAHISPGFLFQFLQPSHFLLHDVVFRTLVLST